jgi:hypothetical protein
MIDQLESRTFLSATPHSALTVLRSDLAGVGRTMTTMITANNSAVANLQNDMSIFPTHLTSDNANLRLLNVRFRTNLTALANDFNNIKLLLGQDITQLIADTNGYNRNPTANAGLVVLASEQLLTAQAASASTSLAQDSSRLKSVYQQALALIGASHPLDATLVLRVSHISTAFATNVTAIDSAINTVAVTDTPNFITALEPTGVITSTVA